MNADLRCVCARARTRAGKARPRVRASVHAFSRRDNDYVDEDDEGCPLGRITKLHRGKEGDSRSGSDRGRSCGDGDMLSALRCVGPIEWTGLQRDVDYERTRRGSRICLRHVARALELVSVAASPRASFDVSGMKIPPRGRYSIDLARFSSLTFPRFRPFSRFAATRVRRRREGDLILCGSPDMRNSSCSQTLTRVTPT